MRMSLTERGKIRCIEGSHSVFRSTQMDVEPTSGAEDLWSVWRQDDSGNRFEVARGLSHSAAEKAFKEFEKRGHKQTYWIEPARPS